MFIDAHAHLGDEKLAPHIEEILAEAKNANVGIVICSSADQKSSEDSAKISESYANVYATVGVHPHEAKYYSKETEDRLTELAKSKKVVAIGEIGLDYHYDLSPRDVQKEVFEKQIVLAEKLGLPIVIHTREAIGDTLEILERNKKRIKKALIHCFNGSLETLKRILDMGFFVSYGGAITFKNANGLLDAVRNTPIDRLLLETDCPYMTPVPYRGQDNSPKHIPLVAEKVAMLKNLSIQEVETKTTENAKKFFCL